MNFLDTLFYATGYVPHGVCIAWDPDLLTTSIIANLGIALAYFVIPFQLMFYRHSIMNKIKSPFVLPIWVPASFSGFIFLCGISHLAKIATLFYPAYWVEAIIDVLTMGISIMTAIFLGLALFHIMQSMKPDPSRPPTAHSRPGGP